MRTPALALALSLALAGPAPAQTFGLDLSTPKTATAAFGEAWAKGDFALAWMVLDPHLRMRFHRALTLFDYGAVFPEPSGDIDIGIGLLDAAPEHMREYTPDGSASMVFVDVFGYFDGIMRAADEAGLAPFAILDPVPMPGATEAEMALAGSGETLRLHLRQSPGGDWRVLRIESDSRALPAVWETAPD